MTRYRWFAVGPTQIMFPLQFVVPETTANEEHYVNPKSDFRPKPNRQKNPKEETQGSKVVPLSRHRKKKNDDES